MKKAHHTALRGFLTALALLALLGGKAQAAVIAQYPFTGDVLTSSDTEANSGAGAMTFGAGWGALDGMGDPISYNFDGMGNPQPSLKIAKAAVDASASTALSQGDYLQFIVTANSGFVLNLNSGSLTLQPAGDDTTWFVRSSVDSFAADIGGAAFNAHDNFATQTLNLPSTGYNGLSSITFRIYAWQSMDEDIKFDNITLNGVVAVPEVGTIWASLLVIGAAIGSARFFGKRKSE